MTQELDISRFVIKSHIHMLRLQLGDETGLKVECIFDSVKGEVTTATLISGDGKYSLLDKTQREVIAEDLMSRL